MAQEVAQRTPPYGGRLVDLLVRGRERDELLRAAGELKPLVLSERQLCDFELLVNGGFSPLDRFMGRRDFERVLRGMRLSDGTLWPMPITLPVEPGRYEVEEQVALRDQTGTILGVMTLEEAYPWNPAELARQVLGKDDEAHPLVTEMKNWGRVNLSGPIQALRLPVHHDFTDLRLTPREVRERLEAQGAGNVVAFQTRNPLHRAHEELTKRAARACGGTLLLHPVVGMTKPGDVNYVTRVRAYRKLVENYYGEQDVVLALLPLAMRMAGPREALWHAIIRRNFGANHFIVGRDHAGPGKDSRGEPWFGPYESQEMVAEHADEIGMKVLRFSEMLYVPETDSYEERGKLPEGTKTASISGTQVRNDYLAKGQPLPGWFTRPEVAAILAEAYPPRAKQGFCVWFTGMSGAGKSTTALALQAMLHEHGRRVTLLDGDIVRTNLSKGLGFSKEDRDTNILRIGFVAAEIVRHGGVALCAAISPYDATRQAVRKQFGEGQFVEVFVDTPLEVCEERDVKGLYGQARAGKIAGMTGVDDAYEMPRGAELTISGSGETLARNVRKLENYLIEAGFLRN